MSPLPPPILHVRGCAASTCAQNSTMRVGERVVFAFESQAVSSRSRKALLLPTCSEAGRCFLFWKAEAAGFLWNGKGTLHMFRDRHSLVAGVWKANILDVPGLECDLVCTQLSRAQT